MHLLIAFVLCLSVAGCAPAMAETGTASYYTKASCIREGTSGYMTASGMLFDENKFTCAMRSRKWGSMFKVTNLDNGRSVIVELTDFGPNKRLHDSGRIIDLSKAAFKAIGDTKKGIIRVKVEQAI
jgi:rare lipoprotein A